MAEVKPPLPQPLLQADIIAVRRGARDVLAGVSLALQGGAWVAIVGPNGAGKSSLLMALAGLLSLAGGQVRLLGRELSGWSARERGARLAWLSQHGDADGEISARDVVRLGRLPRHGVFGAAGADDEAAVDAAMAETECSAFASRRLSELSGGERQRVLLARVLAVGAPVLLLDEPMTHLDAPHQRSLLAGLARRAAAGAAIAVVLHDLNLALAAPRIVVLDRGGIVADGAPGDAALHAALERTFGGAFHIEALATPRGRRWVVVPALADEALPR